MLKEQFKGVFYRVSGKRKVDVVETSLIDGVGKKIGSRTLKERTRFEALKIHEAEAFATEVYKREGIMCEIHEVQR